MSLPSSGNSAPTGSLGGGGGGAKRFLNSRLRLPTMFMYMKGDAGTYSARTILRKSGAKPPMPEANAGSLRQASMVRISPVMPVG